MISRTVTTKEQLKMAKEDKVDEIVVLGQLATELKKVKKIASLSPIKIVALTSILGVATISAPVTGGASSMVTAPAAALTGLEVSTIILALAIGIGLIVAIFKDYEEIEFEIGDAPKLKLRRKRN